MYSSVVILLLVVAAVTAYPSGPPVTRVPQVCTDMIPSGHGTSNATGAAPYTLEVDKLSDANFTVRLVGNLASVVFEGFFIQARPYDSGSESVDSIGTFTRTMDTDGTQTLNCFDGTDNTWGHANPTEKDSVEATWTPPSSSSGRVRFRATVVQGPAVTYWTGLVSDDFEYRSAAYKFCSSVALLIASFSLSVILSQQK